MERGRIHDADDPPEAPKLSGIEMPWTRARKTRNVAQEERLGKMPHGKQQVNSGRFWRWARDGIVWNFLVEARTNEKAEVNSYRIQVREWEQIRTEAFRTPPGLKPAMQITIQNVDLMVIELTDFESMYTRLVELEARYEADTE